MLGCKRLTSSVSTQSFILCTAKRRQQQQSLGHIHRYTFTLFLQLNSSASSSVIDFLHVSTNCPPPIEVILLWQCWYENRLRPPTFQKRKHIHRFKSIGYNLLHTYAFTKDQKLAPALGSAPKYKSVPRTRSKTLSTVKLITTILRVQLHPLQHFGSLPGVPSLLTMIIVNVFLVAVIPVP